MIENRLDEEQIVIDALRMIYNRSLILPLVILINGHGQVGKSTFNFYLGNRICQIRRGQLSAYDKRNTWREWDWKKYTTTTPQEFVELYDNSHGQYLALEEAGEQLNYLEWFSIMARVFTSTQRTQGFHKNISSMITPFSMDIQKRNREAIDFKLWAVKKDVKRRYVKIKPRYIKIDYLKDKWRLGFINDWSIYYSPKCLKEATAYTDWLKQWKQEIADDNKRKVGLDGIKVKYKIDKETGNKIQYFNPFQ